MKKVLAFAKSNAAWVALGALALLGLLLVVF